MWELLLSLGLRIAGSGQGPLWCQPSLYGDWGQLGTSWRGGSECHRSSSLSLPPALLILDYLFIYVCICVCESICVCMHLCVWKPEVSLWCRPQVLTTLAFETESLPGPDVTNFYVGFQDQIQPPFQFTYNCLIYF